MKRLVILALLATVAFAAERDETTGHKNGRFWKNLSASPGGVLASQDVQRIFLRGYSEGFSTAAVWAFNVPEEMRATTDKLWIPVGSLEEVREFLDKFFALPENALISIPHAVRIAAMKFRGEAQKDIDAYTENIRQTAAKEHAARQWSDR